MPGQYVATSPSPLSDAAKAELKTFAWAAGGALVVGVLVKEMPAIGYPVLAIIVIVLFQRARAANVFSTGGIHAPGF